MLRENLKDAGQIILNILSQPLQIPGSTEGISLLQAAQNYQEHEGANSDLSKILRSFLEYPEPTQTLLRELEIIYNEIDV
jgi:hypothetical protein